MEQRVTSSNELPQVFMATSWLIKKERQWFYTDNADVTPGQTKE